jgi:hypothetical protein
LIQVEEGSIGNVLTLIRESISFSSTANYKLTNQNATLLYKFESDSAIKQKSKIEINTCEHFSVFGYKEYHHSEKVIGSMETKYIFS